jgi:hypothetical protein
MNWTWATALIVATQLLPVSQMAERLLDRHLRAESSKIDGPGAALAVRRRGF